MEAEAVEGERVFPPSGASFVVPLLPLPQSPSASNLAQESLLFVIYRVLNRNTSDVRCLDADSRQPKKRHDPRVAPANANRTPSDWCPLHFRLPGWLLSSVKVSSSSRCRPLLGVSKRSWREETKAQGKIIESPSRLSSPVGQLESTPVRMCSSNAGLSPRTRLERRPLCQSITTIAAAELRFDDDVLTCQMPHGKKAPVYVRQWQRTGLIQTLAFTMVRVRIFTESPRRKHVGRSRQRESMASGERLAQNTGMSR
ncbi:hypothetical protein BDK51DRAFT_37022 [Blyttiomyces helicus]|uniref:Uncharacterized protein n=1 Tax=Blyttiomyces helicus TaxID=388810 RepID=A0A4P9WCG3_9FUNG|nr:hypothetical protein BDK51DRAFT_37022 [Blyttiomyces helicus]|eukprot:RKO90351.1 hypothetical protein BDK51DRAFT_37022 [Blyttiomyces helicus]